MSAICLISFDTKKLSFEQLNKLANQTMMTALLNNYAIFYNDCFAEKFMKREKQKTTILLSDSFLYRNADDLLDVTAFAYDSDADYKRKFIKKYSFFTALINVIFSYNIDSINLYITEQGDDDYIYLETKNDNMVEELFNLFIKNSSKTGYTFPNINICIKKSI